MEQLLLSTELKMLQKTVRLFVTKNVIAAEQSAGEAMETLSEEQQTQLQTKARQMDLWFLGAKREWGGSGLSLFEQAVLLEEAVQHRLGFNLPAGGAFGKDLPVFLQKCNEEQIAAFVKPAIQTGSGCFVAVWEPGESNNLNALGCRAVKKGDKWIIDGTKAFVTDAQNADFGIVLVNCVTEKDEIKPALFIVPRDSAIRREEKKLIDVLPVYQLTFSNYLVGDDMRIGELGEGIEFIQEWMTQAQVLLASRCIGVAQKALELTLDYVLLRSTRGKTLAEFAAVRSGIAQAAAELSAARYLVWDAALKLDRNDQSGRLTAKMAKLLATQTAFQVVDTALQFHGGAGFTRNLPFERWYKELRIAKSDFGSSETFQEEIASIMLSKAKN
jgi:acyl-CoA dehydrogenase